MTEIYTCTFCKIILSNFTSDFCGSCFSKYYKTDNLGREVDLENIGNGIILCAHKVINTITGKVEWLNDNNDTFFIHINKINENGIEYIDKIKCYAYERKFGGIAYRIISNK